MSVSLSAPTANPAAFCKLPKTLFTGPLKNLSNDAKLLYALLLDRRSLSVRNDWRDDHNQVYILFTRKETMNLLNCCAEKAAQVMAELDERTGVGLIRRVKKGLGQPTLIYVSEIDGELPSAGTSEDPSPRHRKIRPLDVGETASNKTEVNNTEFSNDPSIYLPQPPVEDKIDDQKPVESVAQQTTPPPQPAQQVIFETEFNTRRQEREAFRQRIKQNIGYQESMRFYNQLPIESHDADQLNSMLEIMVDVVSSTRPTLRVNGEELPTGVVKERFLKIRAEHIWYVIESIQNSNTTIRNIRSYLITALFNSVATLEQHNAARDAQFQHWFYEKHGYLPGMARSKGAR